MKARTGRARAVTEVGLALALAFVASGAGYVAGKASANRLLARSGFEQVDHAPTISAEARMEGLLLFLLGREGML